MAGKSPPLMWEGRAGGAVGTEKCPLCSSQLPASPALPLGDVCTHHFNILLTYFLHTTKTRVVKINLELSSKIVLPMTLLNFMCENLA